MCLTHSTGFSNFYFIDPGQKLQIHFDPGTHFSYSGEGMILLQFVIEHGRAAQGLGLDVGDLTNANFQMSGHDAHQPDVLHDGPETNVADGWNDQGDRRSTASARKCAPPVR